MGSDCTLPVHVHALKGRLPRSHSIGGRRQAHLATIMAAPAESFSRTLLLQISVDSTHASSCILEIHTPLFAVADGSVIARFFPTRMRKLLPTLTESCTSTYATCFVRIDPSLAFSCVHGGYQPAPLHSCVLAVVTTVVSCMFAAVISKYALARSFWLCILLHLFVYFVVAGHSLACGPY